MLRERTEIQDGVQRQKAVREEDVSGRREGSGKKRRLQKN